ncbi:enoyl-CoA hydratase/isomerase family protein [Polaromonas sp. P2-4]|nr:enoyl-CoA hydratase/isomerase family protein [Polaromonas sp. P2-4]
MTNPVTFEKRGRIGLLRIDNPPVNALSSETVAGLIQVLDAFEADSSLEALLVHCDGRTFVAGGDITTFDAPDFSASAYNNLLARIENLTRPVVAVLHGTALGGGLELALACHYRIAIAGTRVGLPEVKLGLVPGSLGTQRLPRLVGAPLSLDLMLSGRLIDVNRALESGIVDSICEGDPLAAGLAYVASLVTNKAPPRRTSELSVSLEGTPRLL